MKFDTFCGIMQRFIVNLDEDEIVKMLERNIHRFSLAFKPPMSPSGLLDNTTATSKSIKIGYAFEEIIREYVSEMFGGRKLCTTIFEQLEGHNRTQLDILHETAGSIILFMEMKIRDDHDDGKSDANIKNFKDKINILVKKYPNKQIVASMYFLDPNYTKHVKKYSNAINKINIKNIATFLAYGSEFFDIFGQISLWNELINHEYRFRKSYMEGEYGNHKLSLKTIKDNITFINKIFAKIDNDMFKVIQDKFGISDKLLYELYQYLNGLDKQKKNNKKHLKCIENLKLYFKF